MSRSALPSCRRARGVSGRLSRSRSVRIVTAWALVVSLVQLLAVAASPHASRALASAADGTGGEFVATQGRVLDTRAGYGTGGYTTPMPANTWRTVTVDGKAGVPSSGVSAVAVTFTATNNPADGFLKADKDEATPNAIATYLTWTGGQQQSNSGVVAVGDDGKIQVMASSSTDLYIDVQGYYTAGDPAAGGYMPVTQARLTDTRDGSGIPTLAAGSTTTIQVAGLKGVPADASAVMLNFDVNNQTGAGRINAYPADLGTRPSTSWDFGSGYAVAMADTVGLSSGSPSGAIKVYVASASVDLVIDVLGYFAPGSPTGAFTPAKQRVWDSRTTGHSPLGTGATTTIQVGGVKGVPAIGSGIGAVALDLTIFDQNGTGDSWTRAWPSGTPEPVPSIAVSYHGGAQTSNLLTLPLGDDGAIELHNIGGTDAIDYAVDVEGWYTNTTSPIPDGQDRTQQNITLQASTAGSNAWVTYRYRAGTTGTFSNVPVSNVKDSNGNSPSSWAVTTSSGSFTPYTWNIRDTLAAIPANNGVAPDSLIQVEACYGTTQTDTNYACGMPANIQFAQSAFGDGFATSDLGPGTSALLTGDYEVDATDVDASTSLGAMSVGRSLTTLLPADAVVAPASQRSDARGVFGPSWTADLRGPDTGNADLVLTDQTASGYLLFTASDRAVDTYQATTSTGSYPISFTGIGDAAANGETVSKTSSTTITMTDPDGTVTSWTKTGSGWNSDTSVTEPGTNSTTSYSYDGSGRVTRILAPVPAGVSCASPDTTPGCRSLILTYQTLTVSGTAVTRLQKISLSAPQTSGTTNKIDIAAYDYNSSGQLADEYDPRITPNLKTAYSYNAAGRLATLTPPGLNAWSFGYDITGRLSTISRQDPTNGTATTTIIYDVMKPGTTAPTLVSAAQAGTWDETSDLPVTGTAIFPPDHQPGGTASTAVSSSDWPYATLDYLDVNGQEVNSAEYGAGAWQIDTRQYDSSGNDIWDLSAGNRAQALAPTSDTDPFVASESSAQAADLLASTSVYDPLKLDHVIDTYGPTHPVTLNSGSTIDARTHVATTYDEGAPNSDVNPATGSPYGLPTTVVTDPYNARTLSDATFPDGTTTELGYGSVVTGDPSGWSLGVATSSAVQMGSSPSSNDLVTYTRYDANGRTIEQRLPGDVGGTTPRTTQTSYYTASGTGSCADPRQAGLPCLISPPPGSGSTVASRTFTYNTFGDPLTESESFGSSGAVRTTTNVYDTGERPTSTSVAVTPVASGGTLVPTVTYGYDSATGLPTTTQTGSAPNYTALATGYDNIGRPTSYTDASGTTATTSYDIDGRPTTVYDGKGTYTYTYDGTSEEHRGLLTSEDIGATGQPSTLSATYDASGNLATETYPNGLVATTHYNNDNSTTSLSYVKSGTTWMRFSATRGDNDRVVAQSSPQSSQAFSYDAAGRLVTVQDTVGSTCMTRTYTLDPDSNRTDLFSYPAGSAGACSTGTTPSHRHSTFDLADRITDTGYTYDDLGRTTGVPATDAVGTGSHLGITGSLTVGYYANDLVASQSQGGKTQTYTLDPDQSRIATWTGPTGATTTNHYVDDSDSPAWTSAGSNWTRNLTGPDGALIGTVDQSGAVTLDFTNLHGDIVATGNDNSTATGVATYEEETEFGQPRDLTNAYETYSWMGTLRRSVNSLGGVALMGARLYSPATGRFLSIDPIDGANANAYVYPADPINMSDPSGMDPGNSEYCRCTRANRVPKPIYASAHYTYSRWRDVFNIHGSIVERAISWVARIRKYSMYVGLDKLDVHHRRLWMTFKYCSGDTWHYDTRSVQTSYQFRAVIRIGAPKILGINLAYHQTVTSPWMAF